MPLQCEGMRRRCTGQRSTLVALGARAAWPPGLRIPVALHLRQHARVEHRHGVYGQLVIPHQS